MVKRAESEPAYFEITLCWATFKKTFGSREVASFHSSFSPISSPCIGGGVTLRDTCYLTWNYPSSVYMKIRKNTELWILPFTQNLQLQWKWFLNRVGTILIRNRIDLPNLWTRIRICNPQFERQWIADSDC